MPQAKSAEQNRPGSAMSSLAFTTFVDNAIPRLNGYFLLRTAGNRPVSEDLVQETLLAFTQSLKRRNVAETDWSNWLFAIARNKCVDFYRQRTSAIALFDSWSTEIEDLSDDDPAISQVADLDALVRLLEPLPEAQRYVLILRYAEGLSIRETADVLGKSEHAIESLLVRSRAALRRSYLKENASDGS